MCDAPEGRVWFEVELKGVMEVRGVEEGVERVVAMAIKGSLVETMGSNGDING